MEMNEASSWVQRRDATADYYLLNVAWMDDWWFIPSPSSNNHTDGRAKLHRCTPAEACDSDARNRGPANVTADLSGRSVYILYLHPAIDTTENKVFSHSESSLNDIVVVQVRARPSKPLRELWSFSLWTWEWWSLKRWPPVVFEVASVMNELTWTNR